MIEKKKKTTLIAEDFFTEIEKFSVKKGMIKIKKFSFFRKINGEISITIMTRKGKPTWWAEAVEFLLKDEILGPIVKTYPGEGLNSKGDIFESVIRSIVGQQISVKASQSIWNRLIGPKHLHLCNNITCKHLP